MSESRATVEYLSKNVSIGTGLEATSVDIQRSRDERFNVDYRINGVMLYLGFAF